MTARAVGSQEPQQVDTPVRACSSSKLSTPLATTSRSRRSEIPWQMQTYTSHSGQFELGVIVNANLSQTQYDQEADPGLASAGPSHRITTNLVGFSL
jgi:hypothetical protein